MCGRFTRNDTWAQIRAVPSTSVKKALGCLALLLVSATASAVEKPDWAFPVTDKVQPSQVDLDKVRTARASTLRLTRRQIDDMYNVPDWFPGMYPSMPKIVRFGNKDTGVRACGSCHLPTGTGHDESAYMAGLPVDYFVRQMADWKSGDRKYGGTMMAMAKVITDAEIKEAAEYFASLKQRSWIRVVEADSVPRSYVGPGNKRLVHPDGGTEPIANRIIEVPEDEETVLKRDPRIGFVAYVPTGSIARGKELAETGDGKTVPCQSCHGPTLRGLGDVPAIAGQHPNYIVRQLWNMQNGDRIGNSATLMKQVVEKLSVDDMLALAAYSASLKPLGASPHDDLGAAFVRSDDAAVLAIIRPLADEGDSIAQATLGDMYGNGFGVPQDYAEAFKWYRRAADQGFASAYRAVGLMYMRGWGVPQDYAEAEKWTRRAVEQGNALAQFDLGNMYFFGWGMPKDYAEALKWYRLSADQGNAFAQSNLGAMYSSAWGVARDYAEAVKWTRQAADQGYATAQNHLGHMYANGWGVPQDHPEAVKWYRLSADQGNATAQSNLGLMYANGRGVSRNYAEALKWYRLAADQGNAVAKNELGVMYANGWGVPQNHAEAAKWYRPAADQDNAVAQYNLGFVYGKGQGVPRDYVRAYMWSTLAAAQGRQDAVKNRETVARSMTRAQIAEAQKLAREWKPKQP